MSTMPKRKANEAPVKSSISDVSRAKAATPVTRKKNEEEINAIAGFVMDDNQEELTITLNKRLRIICGKSLILIEPDGSITIKGDYLESRATGQNRIRGASISLN